jgi:hypothetical protein
MKTFRIKQSDYPEQWPFYPSSVAIENPKNTRQLYLWVGLKKYNFNGVAKKGLPLSEIWLDNPDIPGTKKSIGFIFEICKGKGF